MLDTTLQAIKSILRTDPTVSEEEGRALQLLKALLSDRATLMGSARPSSICLSRLIWCLLDGADGKEKGPVHGCLADALTAHRTGEGNLRSRSTDLTKSKGSKMVVVLVLRRRCDV